MVAMMNTIVEKDIHEQLTRLPLERQRQVLKFAHALAIAEVHGVPRQDLLHFACELGNVLPRAADPRRL